MRSTTDLSAVPVPGLPPGPRPSAPQVLRLDTDDAPEHARADLLREFFLRLGVRYEVATTGREPIRIDLTLRRLPGLELDTDRPVVRFAGIVDGLTEAHFRFDQQEAERIPSA